MNKVYATIDFSDLIYTFKEPLSTPLIDVLSRDIQFRQFRIVSKNFSEYLAFNARQLLEYAFLDLTGDIGKKAFILLSTGTDTVVDAILKNFLIFEVSTPILSSTAIPGVVVGRLAAVFQNILMKISVSENEIPSNDNNSNGCDNSDENSNNNDENVNIDKDTMKSDMVGFFTQLLKYIEDSAVFDMFHTLCMKPIDKTQTQSIEKKKKRFFEMGKLNIFNNINIGTGNNTNSNSNNNANPNNNVNKSNGNDLNNETFGETKNLLTIKEIQKSLSLTDFQTFVLNELEDSKSVIKTINLLSIIRDCLKNPILCDLFLTDKLLESLTRLINENFDNNKIVILNNNNFDIFKNNCINNNLNNNINIGNSVDVNSDNVNSDNVNSDEVNSDDLNNSDVHNSDGGNSEGNDSEGNNDNGNSDDGNSDDGNSDEGNNDNGNSDEGNNDNGNSDDGSNEISDNENSDNKNKADKNFNENSRQNFIIDYDTIDQLTLINTLWRTISAFCNKKTVNFLKNLIDKGLEILMKPFSKLHMYHIFIMDFMAKVALFDTASFDTIQKNYVCEVIMKLVVLFPNSSCLVSSAFRVVKRALSDSEFEQIVLFQLMPFIIILARQSERNASSANSLQFLKEVEEKRKKDQCLNEYLRKSEAFNVFYKGFLKKYIDNVDKPYGEVNTILGFIKY